MVLMLAAPVLASKKKRKAEALREEWSAKIAAVASLEDLESVRSQIQKVPDLALREFLLGNALLKEIQLDEAIYQAKLAEKRKRQVAAKDEMALRSKAWDAKVAAAETLEEIASLRDQAMTEENAGLRKYFLGALFRGKIRIEEKERKRKIAAELAAGKAEMRSRLDSRTIQIREKIENLKKTADVGLVSTIDEDIRDLFNLGGMGYKFISKRELDMVVDELLSELKPVQERAYEVEGRRRQAAYQERQRKARVAEERLRQELRDAAERSLAETEKELEALRILQDRLERIQAYCANGNLYFVETLFGGWVERDEATGSDRPVASFDVNNEVRNRLLELQASGWKREIPARTVACGEGDFPLWEVLR